MNTEQDSEVRQVLKLSTQIKERLTELGFVDDDAMGNIIHHLAELSVWGKKLSQEVLPAFLTLPLKRKQELGELVVDTNYELIEMKQAIEDMEPALIKLMNFMTQR